MNRIEAVNDFVREEAWAFLALTNEIYPTYILTRTPGSSKSVQLVLEMLGRFLEDLSRLQRAVRVGDGAAMEELFTRTRQIRRSIITAGQETAAADFGRPHGATDVGTAVPAPKDTPVIGVREHGGGEDA